MAGRWAENQYNARGGRRTASRRGVAIGGAVVLFAVILLLVMGGEKDEEIEEVDPVAMAMVEAWTRVDAGLALALEDLESGEVEAQLEIEKERAARSVSWEEGRAVRMSGELQPNESLFLSLQRRGVPSSSIHFSVTNMGEAFDFRRSRPGDEWTAEIDALGRILELRYQTSPEDIWVTTRVEQGVYETEKLDIAIDVVAESIAGPVTSSLWLAIEATGESGVLAHRFMEVFQYSIDFNTETRDGDYFAMVFEKIYLDGEFLRYGKIRAALYEGVNARQRAYHYDGQNESGYFDRDGESQRRQFLRSPLEVTRVTSRYGRRVHPITGDSRMHRGVDYGAPIGTRVQAVANGTVQFAGRRGGYGNLLILRHSGGYETRYAHLNRFGRGIRAGVRVSQGQIVAMTGNTGNSTGPHLHYEMLRNGSHIDPFSVRATSGEPLRGADLVAFKGYVEEMDRLLQEAQEEFTPEVLVARNAALEEQEEISAAP